MIEQHFWSNFKLFEYALLVQIRRKTGPKVHIRSIKAEPKVQSRGPKFRGESLWTKTTKTCLSYAAYAVT